MSPGTPRPLPGLRFEAQAPALPEALPRMDVAAFVGFAAAGPIGVPVAVEDPAQLQALFGDDPRLGWDARAGGPGTAHLGPAVRAYFRNGGRRCWVLRVAGAGAAASSVAIPGLLGWSAGRPWQARARARCRGSWGDELGAAAAATLRPLPLPARGGALVIWQEPGDPARPTLAALPLDPAVAARVDPGDLLRVTVCDEAGAAAVAFLPVAARHDPRDGTWPYARPAPSAPGEVTVVARAPLWLAAGLPQGFGAGGVRAWTQDATLLRAALGPGLEPSAPGRATLLLGLDPADAPPPGALLALAEDDGTPASPERAVGATTWLAIEESGASGRDDLPARLSGPVYRTTAPPAEVPLRGATCEQAELELWGRHGPGAGARLGALGLTPGHARYWAALPDDEALLGAGPDATPPPYGALRDAARDPRFPLAGEDPAPSACYAPLGLTPARSAWSTPRSDGRSALERDGLVPLTTATFLDPELAGLGCETLLPTAEYLAWLSPRPRPLTGLHALLWNDEVTVVSVPDAVQPGWELGAPAPVTEPAASAPAAAARCRPADGALAGRGDFFAAGGAPVPAEVPASPAPSPSLPPRWETRAAASPGLLLAVQRALLRLCAARGDCLAVLSTPRGAREEDALRHAARLRSPIADATEGVADLAVAPLGVEEARALSHGALYHPWLQEWEDGSLTVRPHPPDGAVAGVLARRARERGAWIAPANEPLLGVVALDPAPSGTRWGELQDAQVNAVRQEPRGFLALSEDTLSLDPDLLGIHVRRLLALLRRAALRRGASYVFEPLSPAFRRLVERGFVELLSTLFGRGAFAGATPERSFQVDAGALEGGRGGDDGRFFVDLRVAPSEPMRFLRVRLVQSGARGLVTEGS